MLVDNTVTISGPKSDLCVEMIETNSCYRSNFQGRQIFYQTVIVEEGGQDGKDTPSTVTSLHVKCSRPTILGNHTIARRNILPEGFQEECSVDPYLFENFNTVDGDFLTAKFKAFKFPDSTYVQFKGTVNVCLDKCKGVECSAGQIGYGRRKREVSSLPADPNKIFEITITSILKFGDEEIEVVKNDLKFLNDKKLFVADQLREKVYHSEEDPSHLRIEEEYITAESGSVSIALTSWLVATLATIYRLFV
ncbi:hypothetical protein MML48_2g00009560 [Holotrichia oblita]|uniref:Uncharacterized protein n=1 Tax=Holotrichia oblita TaxID=644536 RepID=A0ACB9TJD9_HOLOL|nr:hypothetical protein MML48_2g00009560 [Holotrichia oblita]